jgi:predicted SAM-dependent methyltransferase
MRQFIYRLARKQSWLYDKEHDSMRGGYRHVAHGMLRLGTWAAGVRYRLRPPVDQGDRLNLGSGRSPVTGWKTADINPFSNASVWVDLRDRWPISNEIVSVVYSRHCMEHFTERDLQGIMQQCYRVLEPGGGIRIGVPSLEVAVQQYLKHDFSFAPWLDQTEPIAKTFIRYITDNGNHPILLDLEYLTHILEATGFVAVSQQPGGSSQIIDTSFLPPGDIPTDWVTLYVEARKPSLE